MDDVLKQMDDDAAAVAVAPRVSLEDDIEPAIASEHYFNMGVAACALDQPLSEPLRLLTICVLVMRNGFTVTGESACASPENYNKELGEKIARRHAVEKLWPLFGFALRDRLSRQPSADIPAELD